MTEASPSEPTYVDLYPELQGQELPPRAEVVAALERILWGGCTQADLDLLERTRGQQAIGYSAP
jgi:hypothetical protein